MQYPPSKLDLLKQKSFWIWSLIILSIFVGGYLSARPTYRFIKNWRANQIIDAAKVLEKENHPIAAFEKAYVAYQLAPGDIEIVRYTTQLLSKISPTEALPFWISLAKETNRPEDQAQTAMLALEIGKLEIAKIFIDKLDAMEPTAVRTLLLEAQYLALINDFDTATAIASKIVDMPDAPPHAAEFYTKLSQLSSQVSQRREGIEYLRHIASQKNEEGLDALRMLASYPENTPQDTQTIITGLENNPRATPKDNIIALSLAENIGQASSQEVLKKSAALFAKATPEEMVELGRFFNEHGQYDKTAHCISEKEALKRQDLFLIWADAMAIMKQWDVLERVLSSGNPPIDEFIRHLFLARVADNQKYPNKAQYEWDRAYFEAATNPEQLWYIVRYALLLKKYPQALQGAEKLSTLPSEAFEAWKTRIQIAYVQQDTKLVLKTFQGMAAAYPNDIQVINDLTFIQALLGPLQDKVFAKAESRVANQPNILAYRITLALALVHQGDPEKANALLAGLPVNWADTSPHWQAVYAGILRANQRNALADLIMANVTQDAVLPEEWAFAHSGKLR